MKRLVLLALLSLCTSSHADELENAEAIREVSLTPAETADAYKWHRRAWEERHPPLILRAMPKLKLQHSGPVSEERKREVRLLISRLADISQDEDEHYLTLRLARYSFPPLNDPLTSEPTHVNKFNNSLEVINKLVEYGPDALPTLLSHIDDDTPTRIRVRHFDPYAPIRFEKNYFGNPLNLLEAKDLYSLNDFSHSREVMKYTIKVGDVCYALIGQIVNRWYVVVSYPPKSVSLHSPIHDSKLVERVRELWVSDDPRQLLFESLLRDYCTEGICGSDTTSWSWEIGNQLQCSAATHLLYYYPDEATALISERLNSMAVREYIAPENNNEREVKNRVRIRDFFNAVSWSDRKEIRAALTKVFLETNNDDLLLAALPGVDDPNDEIIAGRLGKLMDNLPPEHDSGSPYGRGFTILKAWTEYAPRTAKQAMEEFIDNGKVVRLQAACAVLSETSPDWKISFLATYLDDSRALKSWWESETREYNGESIPIRLCDIAAVVIASEDPNVSFNLKGSTQKLDRQILKIKRQLEARNLEAIQRR